MNVLLTCASFSPAYGGPAYSVRALAQNLASSGCTVGLWAPDGSAVSRNGDDKNLRECDGSLQDAVAAFGTPDLFHDSGLWWRHNWDISRMARRLGKPLVVSVRGMLEPAALRHRAWKKHIAWPLYQRGILQGAAALHVTSDLEQRNVEAFSLRPVAVNIPNGVSVPDVCPPRAHDREKTAVFIGRLHPIKGLPDLLQAWARIRPADWSLHIAGPDEDGYRARLEELVAALDLARVVRFLGAVGAERKAEILKAASLFVLPSLSENFSVAAAEALAVGVPLLATVGTPWSAIEHEGCGWHVATGVDGLEQGLRDAFTASNETRAAMGLSGHAYVAREFAWPRVTQSMRTLYADLVKR